MSSVPDCPVRCLQELLAAHARGELAAPPVPVAEEALERVERMTPRAVERRASAR